MPCSTSDLGQASPCCQADPQSRAWVVLGVFVASQICLSVAGYGWGPVAPFFKALMDLSSTQVGSISAAFYFTAAMSALPAGILIDRFGVKPGLLGWLGITGVPLVVLWVLKPAFPMLVILAGLSGAGYGIGNPMASKGLFLWFDRRLRGFVFGVKQSAVTIGAAMSGVLLVFLSGRLGPFGALGIIGVAVLVMILAAMIGYRDPLRPAADLRDTSHRSPTRGRVRAGLGACLTDRSFLVLSIVMALFGMTQGIVVSFLILYASEELGYPLLRAGSFQTLVMISGAAGRVLWGVVSDRAFDAGRRPVMMMIAAVSVVTVALLGIWNSAWPDWLFSIVLIGLGLSAAGWNSIALVLATEISDPAITGTAVGVVSTVAWFGLASGPVLFGAVTDLFGYCCAWMCLAAFCCAAFILCLFLPARPAAVDGEPG